MKNNALTMFAVLLISTFIVVGCCNNSCRKRASEIDTVMVTKSTTIVVCNDTAEILWTPTSSVPCQPLQEKGNGKRPYFYDLDKLNMRNWQKIQGLTINGYRFECTKYASDGKLTGITYTYASVSQADLTLTRHLDADCKVFCMDIKDRKMFYYFMAYLEKIYGKGNVYAVNEYCQPISRKHAFCVIWDIGANQMLKLQVFLKPVGEIWYINKTRISIKYKGTAWHEKRKLYD